VVKLFIGNLPQENYGFVHVEQKTAADDTIHNLHHYKLHGVNINVEASKNKSKASTKLHVGNISPTCTNQELRAQFEKYGPVIECDIVKDYTIRGLDNTEFQARLRTAPGMGDQCGCYQCKKEGHWSKECPVDRTGRVADFTEQYNEQYGAVHTPYTMGYGESRYYSDAYAALDYYKRYWAVAAAAAASAEQTMSHLPQVQSTTVTSHLNSTSANPYDRHLLPSSRTAATSAAMAAAPAYCGTDRSLPGHAAAMLPTVGEGYGHGPESELSQASAATRNSLYDMARYEQEQYVDRAWYSAF
uniref:RNA-binding protein 4 n=1 Tax=Nomascus leucogenys TaxID=61853 RepID=A0A2I3GSM8_NOMLE